jgi:PAS domain S-box-containing protein
MQENRSELFAELTALERRSAEIREILGADAPPSPEPAERFRALVERGLDIVTLIGADQRVAYVSDAVRRVLGFEPADFVGRPALETVHPEDLVVLESLHRSLHGRPGAAATQEFRVPHHDGHLVWLEVAAVNLFDDPEVRAIVMVARDVTGRKRVDAVLQGLTAELERRVAQRTAELSIANTALAQAGRAKDEFLAAMSHELRTPLNAVLGLSEALEEEVYGPLADRQRLTVRRIGESGRHLLALINDILDLSKIEAGKVELEVAPFSLDDLCRSSLRLVQEAAHKKNLALSLRLRDNFATVVGDERRLKQVLVNLLSNAVKFTPEGGQVGLEATLDPRASRLVIVVWDTGIGIAPGDLPRLFQPFVQLDSRLSRQHPGTGLGLALVRRLLALQGGEVRVESELDKGSRFTVTLPVGGTAELRPSAGPALAGKISHALIVEDSATAAEHLCRYLVEWGVDPTVVSDPAAVLERVAVEQPHVVFLDILLPAEVGWEILAALKADPRTQPIPVVVVSVLDRRGKSDPLQPDDHIQKPVTRERLREVLTRLARGLGPPAPAPAPAPAGAEPGPGRRILIAEDDETNVATIIDFLRARGHEVHVARNGHEAVALARQVHPDLILMDVQMPLLDGLGATRAIRNDPNPKVRVVPIIALTALAMAGDRERCMEAGVDDHLTKPVSLKHLASVIDERLAR